MRSNFTSKHAPTSYDDLDFTSLQRVLEIKGTKNGILRDEYVLEIIIQKKNDILDIGVWVGVPEFEFLM